MPDRYELYCVNSRRRCVICVIRYPHSHQSAYALLCTLPGELALICMLTGVNTPDVNNAQRIVPGKFESENSTVLCVPVELAPDATTVWPPLFKRSASSTGFCVSLSVSSHADVSLAFSAACDS